MYQRIDFYFQNVPTTHLHASLNSKNYPSVYTPGLQIKFERGKGEDRKEKGEGCWRGGERRHNLK